jgi:hypothetical protein
MMRAFGVIAENQKPASGILRAGSNHSSFGFRQ